MPFSLVENWDSVTAPAVPAGWNNDAGMVTSTSQSNTAPNSLALTSGTAGVVYYATYATADPGNGMTLDYTAFVFVDTSASTGLYRVGPTFRCSSATMNNTSTSCYWVNVAFNNAFTGNRIRFSKIVNGTVTDLSEVANTDLSFNRGTWYSIRTLCYGSDTFNVTLTRITDGYTMNTAGVFGLSSTPVFSSLVASDIASGAYFGLAAAGANTASKLFMDSLGANASGAVVTPPPKPKIIRIPWGCTCWHPD
jgi:hypothetical protein